MRKLNEVKEIYIHVDLGIYLFTFMSPLSPINK